MIGGFGSAVTDVLVEKARCQSAGARSHRPCRTPSRTNMAFRKSCLEVYGLAPAQIAARVSKSFEGKR